MSYNQYVNFISYLCNQLKKNNKKLKNKSKFVLENI